MSDERPVELRPAYVWTCEGCGQDNFHRGIVPEMSAEDERALREEHGIETYDLGQWIMRPTQVICIYCGALYEVEGVDND